MAAKVEPQMSKARQDIESKLIPSGPRVTRYLSLPAEGQTKDWILEEMANMDDYCHASGDKKVNWKDGKLSGAVYRQSLFHFWKHDRMLIHMQMAERI